MQEFSEKLILKKFVFFSWVDEKTWKVFFLWHFKTQKVCRIKESQHETAFGWEKPQLMNFHVWPQTWFFKKERKNLEDFELAVTQLKGRRQPNKLAMSMGNYWKTRKIIEYEARNNESVFSMTFPWIFKLHVEVNCEMEEQKD